LPSGSFTGGAVAKARRFAQQLEDILQSVTESPEHFGEVAGEFAQAIRDHMPAIVGITGAFLRAEAGSMAISPTPMRPATRQSTHCGCEHSVALC